MVLSHSHNDITQFLRTQMQNQTFEKGTSKKVLAFIPIEVSEGKNLVLYVTEVAPFHHLDQHIILNCKIINSNSITCPLIPKFQKALAAHRLHTHSFME